VEHPAPGTRALLVVTHMKMRSRWRVLYRSAQPMSALPKSQPVRSRRADVGQGQRPVYRCTSPHAILDWETQARWLSPQGHSVFGPVRDGPGISGKGYACAMVPCETVPDLRLRSLQAPLAARAHHFVLKEKKNQLRLQP
jgi:hypothetical protein